MTSIAPRDGGAGRGGFAVEPVLVPTTGEFTRVEELAQELSATSFRDDAERFVHRAQMLWHRMPPRYQSRIAQFKRFGDPRGGLYLAGLPTGAVPSTPETARLAAERAPVGAAVLSLIAAGLGDQFGYRPELSGLVIQGVVPMKGAEFSQRSVSSLEELYRHVETSFTEFRADFVGFFCLRGDHDGVAGTTLAPVEAIVRRLKAKTVDILRQPRFHTTVDDSFLIGAGLRGPVTVGDVRVLSGPAIRPRLRVDFAQTTGADPKAQAALNELADTATAVSYTIVLAAGDTLLVENHHALHGRTRFTPRWDGFDRWLLRTFITRDLSRSAEVRPNDGRIIDVAFGQAAK